MERYLYISTLCDVAPLLADALRVVLNEATWAQKLVKEVVVLAPCIYTPTAHASQVR